MPKIKHKNHKRFNDKFKRRIALLNIFLVLVQIIILGLQVQLLRNQNILQDQQKEILKQTSQSNKPDLVVVSSQGDRAYKLSEITDKEAQLGIGVVNLGKAPAPFISIKMKQSPFEGYANTPDYPFAFITQDLKSSEYNSTFFSLKLNRNIMDNFTVGEKNITFKVDCPFCQIPLDEQDITVCVYMDHPTECGDKWKYAR